MKPTQNKRQKIYKKYGGRCAYCGETPTELTLDHITPAANNGTWQISNLNPSCQDCNYCKAIMSLEEFRQEIAKRSDPFYKAPHESQA